MLVTIAGTGGALLMLALADSIPALFVARALSGLFAANISVATCSIIPAPHPTSTDAARRQEPRRRWATAA